MQQDPQSGSERLTEVNLWCAYPDDMLVPEAAEAWLALLSPEERARCDRFRFEKRRREHIATHALKRIALSASVSRAPEVWQFQLNKHGKPSVDPDCGLHFNLSNSSSLVVCLVVRASKADADIGSEVGIDVEPHTRAPEIAKLAPRAFSPPEQAQLALLPDSERPDRALSLWTLKEAYIKARGKGLALPLAGFSFLFDGTQGINLEVELGLEDDPGRWRFCLLNHAEHRIAAMVESRVPVDMNLWEARPFLSPPVNIECPEITWFPRV